MINDKNSSFTYVSRLYIYKQKEYKNILLEYLSDLKKDYPDFDGWIENLFDRSGGLTPGREIIVCTYRKHIAGFAILKDLSRQIEHEKKISTLYVLPQYRRKGIGTSLMQQSIVWLHCGQPLITVSESHKAEFAPLFEHFGFKETAARKSLYKKRNN